MKKKFLILFLIPILSGCTVNYNLEFKDNKFIENIDGIITNDDLESRKYNTGLTIYDDMINNEQKALIDGEDLYNKNFSDVEEGVKYNFSYVYDNNIDKSRLINRCFESPIIKEEDDFYYIKLDGKFRCQHSDKITVNIKSEYAIIDNNADKIKDNTYTWILEGERADIFLAISKKTKTLENNGKIFEISTFKIVSFIILIVLSLITYFLYKKRNEDKI